MSAEIQRLRREADVAQAAFEEQRRENERLRTRAREAVSAIEEQLLAATADHDRLEDLIETLTAERDEASRDASSAENERDIAQAERALLAAALARGDQNWPTSPDAVIDEARKRLAGGGA